MSAIRLEKFRRPAQSLAQARIISPEEIDAIRKEAYENGVREGAAAASDAFSTNQSQTFARLEETISDAFLTRENAHRMALVSFQPLLMSTIEAIAPALAHSGLAAQIIDCVEAAIRNAPEDTLTIYIASEHVDEVNAAIAQHIPKVAVKPDRGMSAGEARISWNDGFDAIDLNANAESVSSAISSFFTELNRPEKMKA